MPLVKSLMKSIKKYNDDRMEKYTSMGFNDKQLDEIHNGLKDDVDVDKYAYLKYSHKHMYEIRHILKYEVKLSHDIDQYSRQQLKVINMGVENDIDTLQYDNPNYTKEEMLLIVYSSLFNNDRLLHHVYDKDVFINKKYTSEQVEEIRKGMLYGLDVTKYYTLNPEEMYIVRHKLLKDKINDLIDIYRNNFDEKDEALQELIYIYRRIKKKKKEYFLLDVEYHRLITNFDTDFDLAYNVFTKPYHIVYRDYYDEE